MPRVPIAEEHFQHLHARLGAIRDDAALCLQRDLRVAITIADVRSNIFLLHPQQTDCGQVGLLKIPPGLHIGMTEPKEIAIDFRPGEGLTGRVFCRQRQLAAQFKRGNWGADIPLEPGIEPGQKFTLTDDQTDRIHEELRWIVSFPLKAMDGDRPTTIGVLSVDGLRHDLSVDQLKLLAGHLAPRILVLATEMSTRVPHHRVSIWIEEDSHVTT